MAVIKVEVYRNLHQDNWSVREQKTGLVIDHVPYICITNAKLVVREGGRKRVIKEQRKNVHAFIRGVATLGGGPSNQELRRISYNPYENESFVLKDTNDSIKWSENVFLDSDGIGWSYGKYN
jgi:hypothetical protein